MICLHYHATTAHKEMGDGEAYILNGIRGLMIILSISPTLGEFLTAVVETEVVHILFTKLEENTCCPK